ncbi:MAG: nickel pincer cofactor biosynthesis protein LarC [Armatimonadetes bacterium]|nr:nickel pincer cofactor biosynthesis protein LarC [Armatimonadota bacterium]
MRIAYFDCFAGVSGDMTLAALLDAGIEEQAFREEIAKLGDLGFDLRISKVMKRGIEATDVDVVIAENHHHRKLNAIRRIIEGSLLSDGVKAQAVEMFTRLAEAEGKVHGHSPEEVHFHEVGAVDAIVDIVGACIGIELLGVSKVYSSALPMGSGFVDAAHGRIPLPAPATVEILKGVPIYAAGIEGETVTPTGAAILRTLAVDFLAMPSMRIETIGYGAGKRESDPPNVLRILVGDSEEAEHPAPRVSIVETNIDDMNPELYEPTSERLFQAGALDVYLTPIQMKKGRPAVLLTAVCPIGRTDEVANAVLSETTSFGVRISAATRKCLDRRWETVTTPYGEIRVKVGRIGDLETASPEYEDCRTAAASHGVPTRLVYDLSLAAYHSRA